MAFVENNCAVCGELYEFDEEALEYKPYLSVVCSMGCNEEFEKGNHPFF